MKPLGLAITGDNLLTESALFSPDLHADLPFSANGAPSPLAQSDLRSQALRMRLAFQAALLKWFRDEGATEHLDRLSNVLDRLRGLSHGSEPRRLWWVGGGVIEEEVVVGAAAVGGLDLDLEVGRIRRDALCRSAT